MNGKAWIDGKIVPPDNTFWLAAIDPDVTYYCQAHYRNGQWWEIAHDGWRVLEEGVSMYRPDPCPHD